MVKYSYVIREVFFKEGTGLKKVIIGAIGVLSSVILFGLSLVSASIYSFYLTTSGGGGWTPNLGPFGTALKEIGAFPVILSVLFFLVGIYFIVMGIRDQT